MSCASSYLSKIVVVEGDPYTEGLKSFKVKKCDSEYKNKRDPTQSVLASDGRWRLVHGLP